MTVPASPSTPSVAQQSALNDLLPAIRAHFSESNAPDTYAGDWSWEKINHGGSDREFYRVARESEKWIVMHYSPAREENSLYADIAAFLRKLGVNIPRLLHHDPDNHLIVVEDLGEVSLHTVFHKNPAAPEVEALYAKALDQVNLLHRQTQAPVKTMPGFDEKLYRWERTYFFDNLVERFAGIQLPPDERAEIEIECERRAQELLKEPLCLIHRDFQSQNLMIRDGDVWLIDFQGMRSGHAAYDVASLLYDPYVHLTPQQRHSLLKHYISISHHDTRFEEMFYRAAVQRLMQALGAYGFLGLARDKKSFLQHIPQGLQNLTQALAQIDSSPHTLRLLRQIEHRR